MTVSADQPLFTWLHLSDLHFRGEGNHTGQELILSALRKDIPAAAEEFGWRPEALFVTGDIAYSGDSQTASITVKGSEYAEALDWLTDVSGTLKVPAPRVFVVPGNHDVMRSVDSSQRDTARLVLLARTGQESIDEMLKSDVDYERLCARQDNFLSFATRFGYGLTNRLSSSKRVQEAYWATTIDAQSGLLVRVAGLNTALVSADDKDFERLCLGDTQIRKLAVPGEPKDVGGVLRIALAHHPHHWLRDGKDLDRWLTAECHISLSGHIHDHDASSTRRSGGNSLVSISAGAAHMGSGEPPSHSYYFASVLSDPHQKRYFVRVWPRKWSDGNKDFRVEIDKTQKNQQYIDYDISSFKPGQGSRTIIVFSSGANSDSPEDPQGSTFGAPPLVDAWVGREKQLALLGSKDCKVAAITGMGGQGKSALAAQFLRNASERNWDWRDFRESGDAFQGILLRIIERLSRGERRADLLSAYSPAELVDELFTLIGQDRHVFVFDNVDKYIDLEGAKATAAVGQLIETALTRQHRSLFLLTCRPKVHYSDAAFLGIELDGLTPDETKALFSKKGFDCTDKDVSELIDKLQSATDGHTLWVTLIATQSAGSAEKLGRMVDEIRKGQSSNVPVALLRSIVKELSEKDQIVLRCLAETVRPEPLVNLATYLDDQLNYSKASKSVERLGRLGLVIFKKTGANSTVLELHPMIKSFVRNEFKGPERTRIIGRIIEFFSKQTDKLKASLKRAAPLDVLESWLSRAELQANAGDFAGALNSLADVEVSLAHSGYSSEFVRVAADVMDRIDFKQAVASETENFDLVFERLTRNLAQLGNYAKADYYFKLYEEVATDKTERFIGLCSMKCYAAWLAYDLDKAIQWGECACNLVDSGKVEDRYEAKHNLALAYRDNGKVAPALEHFLYGHVLEEILADPSIVTGKSGAFWGNIGRCLWFKRDAGNALNCYKLSAEMLETEKSTSGLMNRGWAAFWIAEALESSEPALALAFYTRAKDIWGRCSPSRSAEADVRILKLERSSGVLRRDLRDAEYACNTWIYN